MKTLIEVVKKTAVPAEMYPEYNVGYNTEHSHYEIYDDEEEQCGGMEPDHESYDYHIVGPIGTESKIC